MRTDDLIVHLAGRSAAVVPLPSPGVRWTRWMIGAIGLLAIAVFLWEPRADLTMALSHPAYLIEALLTLSTAMAAVAAALFLAVPGAAAPAIARWAPIALAAGWAGMLGIEFAAAGAPWPMILREPVVAACVAKTLSVGVPSGVLLFWLVRRAAPLDPAWIAGLASLGALAIGAFGARVECPIDRVGHLIAAHATPVMLLAIVATAAGRWLLIDPRGRLAPD